MRRRVAAKVSIGFDTSPFAKLSTPSFVSNHYEMLALRLAGEHPVPRKDFQKPTSKLITGKSIASFY